MCPGVLSERLSFRSEETEETTGWGWGWQCAYVHVYAHAEETDPQQVSKVLDASGRAGGQ